MSTITKVLLLAIFLVASIYLAVPSPRFPKILPDGVQSLEEADVEDSHERRAYFTNMPRSAVIDHYKTEIQRVFPISLPVYIVYHPPEDAYVLIRDQTRSVHLPEIIFPWRESVFVNIFEAGSPKDAIGYRGIAYERKVTIRYLPTSPLARIIILVPSLILLVFLLSSFIKDVRRLVILCFRK
ncbi:MAG: hypothetical protein AAB599_03215 [Patescibacteria group bacterium]